MEHTVIGNQNNYSKASLCAGKEEQVPLANESCQVSPSI